MFASRLKAARERLGLNQTELARLIGVEQQQINRWEAGRNVPNIETAVILARALNVTGDYLLGLVDTFTGRVEIDDNLSPEERRVLSAMRRGDKVDAIKVIVGG